jgi:EAL domain-containing protein (putative c-di-GMP-specific phosphodiesterase class I)/FixJ family two-component response regulator
MSLPPVAIMNESVKRPVVYVVDDDSNVAALVARMLERLGCVPFSFDDPATCLRQLKSANSHAKPMAIVLDLALGRYDAVAVVNELRASMYKGKVLLISGHDEATLLEIHGLCASRGIAMLPWLKKPFQLEDLRRSLNAPPRKSQLEASNPQLSASGLQQAIASNALALKYQPIFNLKSMLPTGVVAIPYAQHPTQGLVPTGPAPSDSSLQHPLSRFVLQRAIEDWISLFSALSAPPKLVIPVPLAVVAGPSFIPILRKLLPADPKFPGLIIDVTDWRSLDAEKSLHEISALLRLYRIGLSITDIGTIYDSILHPDKCPFVQAKLPREAASNCSSLETQQALCRSIIDLAHRANAAVCAEGLTSRDDLRALVDWGCDLATGDLFGRPQPGEALKRSLFEPTGPSRPGATESAVDDDDPCAWPTPSI